MKFLLINYEYPPIGAGAATATQAIARNLVKLGHEVTVLTARYGDLPSARVEDGVTVRRIKCLRRHPDRCTIAEMTSFVLSALLSLVFVIPKIRPTATIAFFSIPCGPIALFAKTLFRIPYVVSLRGGDVPGLVPEIEGTHRFLQSIRRASLERALAVIANSNGLRDLSIAADPSPVGVIPNGVDTEFFSPSQESRTSSAPAPFRVLFVGRFHSQKNLRLLLSQFARLRNESAKPVELHLVGDGPLLPELKEQAAKLKLNGEIKWHGWLGRSELRGVLQSCDCFVNPSLYEGMPNAVLEAMACGKPVVASRISGNDAVVDHEATGLLFPLDKPGWLGESLQALIDDPARAKEMGRLGREWVTRDFSWKKVALDYIELFEGQKAVESVRHSRVGS
jgi:glycosyltransferase involved in cell wall biosynthesis